MGGIGRTSWITSLALALALPGLTGCATGERRTVLWQNTPIIALYNGNYDAIMTVGEAKKHGDFGIGAFDRLDGEMLALDGVVYQVTSDGKVHRPPDEAGLCFTAVTRFTPEHESEIPRGTVFTNLAQLIDPKLPTVNAFYAMRVKGLFSAMMTRAVPGQKKPYAPLCEVVKTQPKFHFENVAGTMVGFRGPPYIGTLNAPGYHFHFLTADQMGGGHVLSFTVDHAVLEWTRIDRTEVGYPTDATFNASDLKKINNCSGAEGPSAE
jgi:acetolactate decarboxylase